MLGRLGPLSLVLGILSGCEPSGGDGDVAPLGGATSGAFPHHIAKRWGGILLEFGLPEALPLLSDDGWSYGEIAPDGNPFRWAVAEEASFYFESDREGERLGFLELEPFRYEGAPAQFVGITVNGSELDPIELREGRARYPIDLPLVRGRNDVLLRFRYAGDPTRSRADHRRLAVAFYRLDVAPDEEALVSGRPGPFAWVDGAVYVPPEASLSFFRDDGASSLSVVVGSDSETAPQLRAPKGALLTLTARAGSEIWQMDIVVDDAVARWAGELPFDGGEPIQVTLATKDQPLLVRPLLNDERSEPEAATPVPSSLGAADVLVIVLDGANALRTGLYGYERDTTPVLDRLGRDAVVFDVAVSQAVYTIASIGSFLTGQYPDRNQTVSFADRLPDTVVTLPGLLTEAGFRTGAFAGNAVVSDAFGLDRGYETFVSVPRLEGYTGHGDSVVSAFRSWVSEIDADERFFAYVHFREPHFPYNPPAPFDARFGSAPSFPGGMADADRLEALNRELPSPALRSEIDALYDGNLAYVDSLVGEVLDCVDDSTIVIVTADHGEAIFEHGFLGHNTQLYDESIRIPLIVKLPGVAPKRVSRVVELLDLTPTLLELSGLAEHPALGTMQGESLLPWLLGNRTKPSDGARPRAAFTRTVWDEPRYSVRTETHKLIWDSRTGETELYDLEADPGETNDLSGEDDSDVDVDVDADADVEADVEAYLRYRLFSWYKVQERLKAGEPPPPSSQMSPDERREFGSLGYTGVMKP